MKTYFYLFLISMGFFGLTSFSDKNFSKSPVSISATAYNNTPVIVTVTCSDITSTVLNPAISGSDSGSLTTDPLDPMGGITVKVDFTPSFHGTYYAHLYADGVFYKTLTFTNTNYSKKTFIDTHPSSSVTVVCDNIP